MWRKKAKQCRNKWYIQNKKVPVANQSGLVPSALLLTVESGWSFEAHFLAFLSILSVDFATFSYTKLGDLLVNAFCSLLRENLTFGFVVLKPSVFIIASFRIQKSVQQTLLKYPKNYEKLILNSCPPKKYSVTVCYMYILVRCCKCFWSWGQLYNFPKTIFI